MDDGFAELMRRCKYSIGSWAAVRDLDEKVREYLATEAVFSILYRQAFIQRCESPIEQLMTLALLSQLHADGLVSGESKFCHLFCQRTITTLKGIFRVDILLTGRVCGIDVQLVVECDGHDFHEKTKKQAAADKARDRALLTEGYTVLRFTGSEIWADADKCANEAVEMFLRIGNDPLTLEIDAMLREPDSPK